MRTIGAVHNSSPCPQRNTCPVARANLHGDALSAALLHVQLPLWYSVVVATTSFVAWSLVGAALYGSSLRGLAFGGAIAAAGTALCAAIDALSQHGSFLACAQAAAVAEAGGGQRCCPHSGAEPKAAALTG
jgi:hypothetical protein